MNSGQSTDIDIRNVFFFPKVEDLLYLAYISKQVLII